MSLFRHHRLSYNWRLFMPVTVVLWSLIVGLSWWQLSREEQYRREFVDAQLEFVNSRILDAINTDNWTAIRNFLNFSGTFYIENPLFSDIRVTVFDDAWHPIINEGSPIQLTQAERHEAANGLAVHRARNSRTRESQYYYMCQPTPDRKYYVVSALPDDAELHEYLNGDRSRVWLTVLIVGVIFTIFIWFTTRYLTRNIRLLREFANRTATDPGFIPAEDFPHGEIGDVARQIVAIYNERAEAQRRVEREHAVAMHAIEEKALQKRQLTNNINHELKTPIGVIKGYLDTLADNPDIDPEMRKHFIVKARDHANRLTELINDVSAVTRLQDGANLISTDNIDYHELAYTFASEITESGVMGKMRFEYDVPMGTIVVGNASLLTGMLMNLAKNSANYSGGTYCVLVCNGLTDDATAYSFSFYDNGSGVPDTALPHLFDRFYRVDSGRARKSGGTGLGLAIVEQTISAHQGTVTGINRPGAGLEIRFTLPRGRRR